MHAKTLIEITARLALEASEPQISETLPHLDQAKNYWSAAKCRLQAWQRTMRFFAEHPPRGSAGHDTWPALRTIVEEILLSELATRIWTAILAQADHDPAAHELTGIANGIFVTHLELSNQALRLLLELPPAYAEEVERLNHFRQRLERWTDLLLGCLRESRIAARYSFDRQRMVDFALDHGQQAREVRVRAQRLLAASLSADLRGQCSKYAANPELNRQIAAGMLQFFTPERFDSLGLLRSSFMLQLERNQQDLDALCSELATLEQADLAAPPPPRFCDPAIRDRLPRI